MSGRLDTFDVAIVGGGIVGVATAHALRAGGRRVVVLEKEPRLAAHQSSRNSGVLHTGVYYVPGSAKAVNCRSGYAEMLAFCRSEGLPVELCGKVIVAVDDSELERLDEIERRGIANGVRVSRVDAERLGELEPHARGVAALHVPEAGIADYGAVVRRLAERVTERASASGTGPNSEIRLETTVTGFEREGDHWRVDTSGGPVHAGTVVNCAGLYSDRVAAFAGADPALRIVPFRGEYFALTETATRLCRGLIYPVPDPAFPFLGVHFTRTVHGGVECGPNAVLALSREGYTWGRISAGDMVDALTWPGLRRLVGRHWRAGAGEMWRSLNKGAFVTALQRLVPEVRASDLVRAPAGVRAQALTRDGALVEDFVILADQRMVHVCNAPSPAATSSLSIARRIVAEVEASEG